MRKGRIVILLLSAVLITACTVSAESRFPHPEFESGYGPPRTTAPAPRLQMCELLDVLVLAGVIGLTCYMAFGTRSRRGILLTSVFSIMYFGFYREGCVCSVGSVQNVAAALFNRDYILPVAVMYIFAIPLLTALFFGRVFCAAVCPLGALQDVVILSPRKVPRWLSSLLQLIPVVYLGLAVLLAATGARFIICQFDPFVSFFRFGGSLGILLTGAAFLIAGTVIARPYCRFVCPYGLILGWLSRVCKYHTTITPDECIKCRLCENSCPFDAIRPPEKGVTGEERSPGIRRLTILLLLLPLFVAAGGGIGARLHGQIALLHPTVSLARQVWLENSGAGTDTTIASRTFRESGIPDKMLFDTAEELRGRFLTGSRLLGAFVGMVICGRLIYHSVSRRREGYTQDEGLCFVCGRCYKSCPVDGARRREEKNEQSA